jgi:hypothetical protein
VVDGIKPAGNVADVFGGVVTVVQGQAVLLAAELTRI